MESQTEEWKESWRIDFLDTLCAFATTDGGTMFIGRKNNGEVIGVRNSKKLLEESPNTVHNKLRFHPIVKTVEDNGKTMVAVTIEPQKDAIFLDGCVYVRSGSTTVKLSGQQLIDFLMERSGMSWTDTPAKNVEMSELSKEALKWFVNKGISSGRMSPESKKSNTEALLKRYDMMDKDGLRKSAAILFLKEPAYKFHSASVMIGAFNDSGRLLRHDKVNCPVIMQPDKVMDVLLEKYIQGIDDVEYLERIRKYPYPVKALREAVMNATIHRDYSSGTETYISVYPNHVEISNPGRLPAGWTADDLMKKHDSKSPNRIIANAFYDIGYIEKWGSGIGMMVEECKAMGIQRPEYVADDDTIRVTFKGSVNRLGVAIGLNDTENAILDAMTKDPYITSSELALQLKITDRAVRKNIASLKEATILEREGSNRTGKWIVRRR
jgi:ATP-dependent DNA helicase RecG